MTLQSAGDECDEDLLESLDRHFLVGNAGLTKVQVDAHRSSGTCRQCDEIAQAAAAAIRGQAALPSRPTG